MFFMDISFIRDVRQEMQEKNRVVHHNTVECYRSLTGEDPPYVAPEE